MLGYALARQGLPFRGIITFLVFFTMLFNGGLVPTYVNYTNVFHLKDTFFALLIPGLMTNGFYILLMKSYFVTGVPNEIMEAAYIDGATVTGKIVKQGKGKKVTVFTYRPKKDSKRKMGHRQLFTKVEIGAIKA